MQNSRRKDCICRCQSHCTTYNQETYRWEGGQKISRSLRELHRRDDQTTQRLQQATTHVLSRPETAPELYTITQANHDNYLALIRTELKALAVFPISSPLRPLNFIQNPKSSDAWSNFSFPTLEAMIQPNTGPYALNERSHCNASYLDAEFRLCEVYKYLSTIRHTEDVVDLQDAVYSELERMNEEKAFQWSQQIVNKKYSSCVVNTGVLNPPLQVTCN